MNYRGGVSDDGAGPTPGCKPGDGTSWVCPPGTGAGRTISGSARCSDTGTAAGWYGGSGSTATAFLEARVETVAPEVAGMPRRARKAMPDRKSTSAINVSRKKVEVPN